MNSCCEISTEKRTRCFSVKEMLETQDNLNKQLPVGNSWSSAYSVDHFLTAIVGEMGEIIDQDTAPQWKWWKARNTDKFSMDMAKLEIVDVVHFWLSIAMIKLRGELKGKNDFCLPCDEFAMYENLYVGDESVGGSLMIEQPGYLLHSKYMDIVRLLVCGEQTMTSTSWVDTLNALAASVGMDCEELSAFYQCKATLNSFRWENPDWEKVTIEGVEDNQRLFPLVHLFMLDKTMTLEALRVAVVNEFFQEKM